MDNATSVNRAMSLEQEVDTLRTDLTMAEAKLHELTTDFHQRDIKSCELSVFQEFSAEISRQRLICEQLRTRYTEAESRLGEQQRRDAIAYEAQQRHAKWGQLTQQLSNLDTRMEKARSLIQEMQRAIDALLPERNVLLQQLAELKQQLGENGVN